MDKKLGLILVIVIILALGIGGWFLYQDLSIPKIKDLKEVLPTDAMVFLETKDLKQTWAKFKNTELYNLIESLKERLSKDNENIAPAKSFLDAKIKKLLEGEIIGSFGKLGISCIYRSRLQDFDAELPQILFVTRLLPKAKIEKELLETFMESKQRKDKKNKISSQKYLGLSFKVINLDNKTQIAYFILRDTLILSNNPGLIKDAIDVLRNKRLSLWEDKRFKLAYEEKSTLATIFVYTDLKKFSEFFLNSIKLYSDKNKELKNLDNFTEMFKAYGLPEFDYSTFNIDTDKGLHLRYSMVFDSLKMNQELRNFWSATKLKDLEIIRLLPRNTILFGIGASSENAADYYRYIGRSIEELKSEELKRAFKKQKQQIEDYFRKLGYEYEKDILPLIKETGFAFLGLEQVSFMPPQMPQEGRTPMNVPALTFPFPRLCALIGVNDRPKAEAILSKVIEDLERQMQEKMPKVNPPYDINTSLPQTNTTPESQVPATTELPSLIQEEIYNEIKIKTLSPAVQILPFLSPSFCFLEDYLVLGINDKTVKNIIDSYKDKRRSFESNIDFIDFSKRMPVELMSAFYMDGEGLSKEIFKLKETSKLMPKGPASDKFEEVFDIIVNILVQLNKVEGHMVSDEEHFAGDIFINIKGL